MPTCSLLQVSVMKISVMPFVPKKNKFQRALSQQNGNALLNVVPSVVTFCIEVEVVAFVDSMENRCIIALTNNELQSKVPLCHSVRDIFQQKSPNLLKNTQQRHNLSPFIRMVPIFTHFTSPFLLPQIISLF